jgi:hypothetical protein
MNDQTSKIASALYGVLESPNESDRNMEAANVVDGLFAIARALDSVAQSITSLGLAEAMTPMGAIELLAKEVRDGLGAVAAALDHVAMATDP